MGLTRRASGAGRATQHCVAGSDPGGGLIRGLRPAANPSTGTEARQLARHNRPREWTRRCTVCQLSRRRLPRPFWLGPPARFEAAPPERKTDVEPATAVARMRAAATAATATTRPLFLGASATRRGLSSTAMRGYLAVGGLWLRPLGMFGFDTRSRLLNRSTRLHAKWARSRTRDSPPRTVVKALTL